MKSKALYPLSQFLSLAFPEAAPGVSVVSVISGGLDSSILTAMLVEKYGAENVYPLSFDYRQKQREELNRAAHTCMGLGLTHKVIDMGVLGDIARVVSTNISGSDIDMPTISDVIGDPQPVTYVPYRNMILNAFAMSYAESVGASYVFSGLQATDSYGYWDTTSSFVDAMNGVSALNRKHKIQLKAPFTGLSKKDEIGMALQLKTPMKFESTLTCYNPDKQHRSCGVCPSCSERISAFIFNGIKDPVEYSVEIPWEKYGVK